MGKANKKTRKATVVDKAFAAWLKYDPLVSAIVKNDDNTRRDVMLNILGTQAAMRHFGKFPPRKAYEGPIFPDLVRREVEASIDDQAKRTRLIKTLIRWATDPQVNNRYIRSHLTRIQIVRSLLGQVFFNATKSQEDLLLKGLKFMIAKKMTVIGELGEQSADVHDVLLERISEILIHNQKVIIKKAVSEAEEKMRVHLMRQIQEMRGEKHPSSFVRSDLKNKVRFIVKEKFPLSPEAVRHLEDMLEFYLNQDKWPYLSELALNAQEKILELRKPLTLTARDSSS